MGKVCNMVKVVKFKNADDLYSILDDFMNTDGELSGDRRCYRVQDLKLIDENHALVYLEEDFTVVRVHFLFNGKEVSLLENPYNETFFSYQEVQLMNELGTVALEEMEYDIEEIKYCIDECGVRYVEIILS